MLEQQSKTLHLFFHVLLCVMDSVRELSSTGKVFEQTLSAVQGLCSKCHFKMNNNTKIQTPDIITIDPLKV